MNRYGFLFLSFALALPFSLLGQIKINANLLKLARESAEVSLDDQHLAVTVKSIEKSESDSGKYDVLEILSHDKKYFGMVDEVKGKTHFITYMVLFRSDGVIEMLDVLIYRESYGGEVDYAVFKNQFKGKSGSDHFTVGKNIRNISGATISVNSVTRGVQKLTHQFELLKANIKI